VSHINGIKLEPGISDQDYGSHQGSAGTTFEASNRNQGARER